MNEWKEGKNRGRKRRGDTGRQHEIEHIHTHTSPEKYQIHIHRNFLMIQKIKHNTSFNKP